IPFLVLSVIGCSAMSEETSEDPASAGETSSALARDIGGLRLDVNLNLRIQAGEAVAIGLADSSRCRTRDCRGLTKRDSSYCETNACRGLVKHASSWCTTSDCRGRSSRTRA